MKLKSKLASLTLIALMLLGTAAVFTPRVNAVTTTMEVISTGGLTPGTNSAHYNTLPVGTNIVLNITVFDVTDLQNFQVKLGWDDALLDFVSIAMPSDGVFAGKALITPPPQVEVVGSVESVMWGATYINDPYFTFNGTGVLAQVTLQVAQSVDILNQHIFCALPLMELGSSTFMIDGLGTDISFTTVDGDYDMLWIVPGLPTISFAPSVEKPAKIGDTFGIDVMISNVDSGWGIIGVQFSVMWNTTFMEPAAVAYAPGTFMEGFQYYTDGVLYAADVNTHNRPLPMHAIADDYNYSTFAVILLPDADPNPPYHAPYANGNGKLMTIYFTAIYDTLSPTEDWTWIQFIHFTSTEDTYALNNYLNVVNLNIGDEVHYRAPQKILGLSIDVYTQYPFPYGGQGGNQSSDSFGPQDLVNLFADVTYNEYGVQQKLVGFQIFHEGATQTYNIYREGTTDVSGIASVSFRLPWPCADPVGEIFGWWYVNATVEVAGEVVVDNLRFWVWWPVEVVSIEPKTTSVMQSKQGTSIDFEMIYLRYDVIPLNATLTATVYDELGFFIGSAITEVYNFGATGDIDPITDTPIPVYGTWDFTIPIPSNAVVGKCIVYGNAFTDLPWNGGVPYCPEVTNTIDFFIVKP
jgi:hypothetical protein